ncbi:MAG: hypothetical protein LBH39_08170 [Clostridiales Family XIII bacterium]|nr:hypothetical protein [Clostridiales Family XIII bacterium]MDR0425405.1 hypothetical protein [Clostridiales Family XIII bacterium]
MATVNGAGLVTLRRAGSVTISIRANDGSGLVSSAVLMITP